MRKKKAENYLDYVPVRNGRNTWDVHGGTVTIHMAHRGIYHAAAQKLFHTPRVSHIELDVYGSFLWQRMDGQAAVGQLAQAMKDRFGQDAEPLYDRLVQYVQILRNNELILFRGRDKVRP